MNFEEIKKLIEEDGGKIIIVENDEPVMVVTSFEDYKKGKVKPEKKTVKAPSIEKEVLPPELASEELKIEDLPF